MNQLDENKRQIKRAAFDGRTIEEQKAFLGGAVLASRLPHANDGERQDFNAWLWRFWRDWEDGGAVEPGPDLRHVDLDARFHDEARRATIEVLRELGPMPKTNYDFILGPSLDWPKAMDKWVDKFNLLIEEKTDDR